MIDELDGCAEGAGVDPLAFFACSMEEIWYEPRERVTQGRCSDVVAGPTATANGHLLVGHTNDLGPAMEDQIVAIEKRVTGDPTIFQLGGIPWLSVGWNSAGLSLTGNELSPNDEQVGISRSHQVLEMMRARTLDEMVAMALRPDRASSYNNVLTSADGGVANVEGSATDAEVTGLDDAGHLAHTNHYVCDRMLPFEGDPDYAKRSAVRFERARTLLAEQPPASITETTLRTVLSDHEGAPDSICRHPEPGDGEAIQDRVLVHRRRHRRSDHVRPRQPLRLRGAGLRVLAVRGLIGRAQPPRRAIVAGSPRSVARSNAVRPSSFTERRVGAGLQQERHHRRAPVVGGGVQRCPAARLTFVR